MRDQTSLAAVQWLTYIQEVYGKDSKGNFCQLHHGFHQGEKNVDGKYPDGYMFRDGEHKYFEFNGKIVYIILII